MSAWWLGLAPAQATVTCADHLHRLRWEDGELRALDHDDPDGERALAALGGLRCTCTDLLNVWARHRDDARVLVLASRGPTDQLASSGRRGPVPRGPGSHLAGADNELVTLLGLAGGLQDRLVATVAASWRDRLRQPDSALLSVRPQLDAALHGRASTAIHGWLGATAGESRTSMIGEDGEPKLIREDDVIRAELPFGWLIDVWAKGLATIWGRFCLASSTSDGRAWRLTTVGPDLESPALITVTLPDEPVPAAP
jgi:hypothetical protein